MRHCSACETDKSDEDFSWRNRAKQIRQNRCRVCYASYQKTHYSNNKEKYVAKARRWNATNELDNKKLLLAYLQEHPCVDCGEPDFEVLEFDHREPGLKEFSVCNRLATYTWTTLKREIDKCDVRCANCHRRKTNKQFGFWRADYSIDATST